jgi:hypothetical protein
MASDLFEMLERHTATLAMGYLVLKTCHVTGDTG